MPSSSTVLVVVVVEDRFDDTYAREATVHGEELVVLFIRSSEVVVVSAICDCVSSTSTLLICPVASYWSIAILVAFEAIQCTGLPDASTRHGYLAQQHGLGPLQ